MSVPRSRLFDIVKKQVVPIEEDSLILSRVTTWGGIAADCFKCDMCREYCDVGYETDWQWGTRDATERRTYVDWMCRRCLSDACKVSSNAQKTKYVI